ncbi:hypothetical protein E2986_09921 [Frieseomelitta varia]|uniref:Uncharacterized protein n=1 Tax=Frieseomelitta varia TaxID=561572 RepID=A0A833W730_9HYME|nr:hypothetical protein E2986_09921 [Frieseomelitta varia]
MGDSDDEYDRKRRDKFRGERTESYSREGRRDDRRRDDWVDRCQSRQRRQHRQATTLGRQTIPCSCNDRVIISESGLADLDSVRTTESTVEAAVEDETDIVLAGRKRWPLR